MTIDDIDYLENMGVINFIEENSKSKVYKLTSQGDFLYTGSTGTNGIMYHRSGGDKSIFQYRNK